jgi:hypothetical protein
MDVEPPAAGDRNAGLTSPLNGGRLPGVETGANAPAVRHPGLR